MQKAKKILRITGLVITTWFLWLTVGAALSLLAPTIHLTNRDTVKNWPVRADVYDSVIDLVPDVVSQEKEDGDQSLRKSLEDAGLDADQLLAAIKTAVPPAYLEQQVNTALDALYDTLEGKSDALTFTIPLSEKSDELSDAIADELIRQVSSYPACTPIQLTTMASGEFNPLESECIPPGVNVKKEIRRASKELTGGDNDGLDDIVVTAGDLSPVNDNVDNLQSAYAAAQSLGTTLLITALLLSVAVVLLSRSAMYGIRKVGGILVIQGVGMTLFYFLMPRLGMAASGGLTGGSEEGTQQAAEQKILETVVEPMAKVIFGDISSTGLRLSIFTVALGAALWLGVYIWHKVHHEPQDAHVPAEKRPGSDVQPPIDDSQPEQK